MLIIIVHRHPACKIHQYVKQAYLVACVAQEALDSAEGTIMEPVTEYLHNNLDVKSQ